MKRLGTACLLLAALGATASAQTTVTIEKIARSVGNSIFNRDVTLTDPVPGRSSAFLFWSSAAEPPPPVINEAGEVVFKAFSASATSINSGAAFGIYAKRPGFPLAVLMDTTNDGAGTGTFAVPGHPGSLFSAISGAPMVNNAGDVLFEARFVDLTTFAQGSGFYSTTTSGGPIVKIVDTFDPVASQTATTKFENFTFTANNASTFGASMNDLGQVVYWAQFCDGACTSSARRNGIFGTTVSGAAHVRLADSTKTICPTGIPVALTCDGTLGQGFWEIRPEIAINNAGVVAFHGGIRQSLPSSRFQGTYAVPVTGGVAPTTVAFETQIAPPATATAPVSTFNTRFDDNDINDAGDYMFLPLLTAACCQQKFGLFSGNVSGGAHGSVVDTLIGNGLVVPGDTAGAEFAVVAMASMNASGQMGFYGAIRNSGTPNNNGIYAADIFGTPISRVMDAASTPPGQPVGANITSFRGLSAVINDDGNMAFAGTGIVPVGASLEALFGLYFFDACTSEVVRISDSTTALTELGVGFGGITTGGSIGYQLFQSGAARAGKYSSMNNSGDVAFLAKFSNFGMGLYVAHITSGTGGSVAISCPADLALDCGADTTPGTTGTATSSGCAIATVSFSDIGTPGCGGTQTIARTWTANDGAGGTASCVQTITSTDTAAPSLVGIPLDQIVECDAVPTTASVTATDACDASPVVSFSELSVNGSCPNNVTLMRTWTATDACGNTATADQAIDVTDTTPPDVACPVLVSTSGGFGGVFVTFTPTAADACDPAPAVSSEPPSGSFFATGATSVSASAADSCANVSACGFDVLVSCYGVNRAKIGTKESSCRGIEWIELTSSDDTDDVVSLYKAEENSGGAEEDTLPPSTIVDDGFNQPVTIDTSCATTIQVGDVYGAYTVTDVKKDFDDIDDVKGSKVELRGSFVPATPFDLALDDVTWSIDDGMGHVASFTIPAGSFQMEGNPNKAKFKFKGDINGSEVRAKFEKCKFRFEAKNAMNTGPLVGTSMAIRLVVGANVGEETLVMEDKKNHLSFKRKPKLNCCPECNGIASMQVTSSAGVLVIEPAAGQTKLPPNTTVDDGVNGAAMIPTSGSQPIEVGDVFGPYTVSELVKIFDTDN